MFNNVIVIIASIYLNLKYGNAALLSITIIWDLLLTIYMLFFLTVKSQVLVVVVCRQATALGSDSWST